jgi:glycosyltransferase involved in cell wall biosynthesis
MPPIVSIVIPTYNRASDLKRALASVRAQTYDNWEALIVDNHSTDDTDEVVAAFDDPRLKLLKVHNHGVIATSRNLGVKDAAGEYIAFLDSDDWWTPEKLARCVALLDGGAEVVYHDLYLVTKENQRIFWRRLRSRWLQSPVFEDLIVGGNPLPNSSVVVRKTLLQQLGGLSEDNELAAMEDFDIWLRAARITEKFQKAPGTLGYYWAVGGNTSNPRRTLSLLDLFEQRYASQLPRRGSGWWLDYSRGRAYYELGAYNQASSVLRGLSWHGTPFAIVLRTNWMLMISRMRAAK